jgi:predicted PurR-regulated permease PerM
VNPSPKPPSPPRADFSLIIIASVLLVAALGFLAWLVAQVLLLVFAGILVAVLLRGLGNVVSRLTGLSDGWSLAVVMVLLGTLLVLMGWFLGAEIVSQLDELVPRLQKAWEQVRGYVRQYDWGRTLLANTSFKALAKDREWLASVTGGFFSTTLGLVAGLLVVFFIGLYAAIAPEIYLRGMLRLVPLRARDRASEVMVAVGNTLNWWLIGALARMALVGLATTVGLLALGMPLALALGLIAFGLEFVPYLGPILAAIPALLVAVAVGPDMVAYVALLYLAIQAAENYVISPLIDQRAVLVPPVLTIAAQLLLGSSSLALLGVFIATPLTAVTMVLVKMLYIEDQLGECTDVSEGAEGAVCIPAQLPEQEALPGLSEENKTAS